MCAAPYKIGVEEFGCNVCDACCINKRRLWTSRLMLESYEHEASFFVTLTYRPEDAPKDGSVSVRHAQLFLKRLRDRIAPERVRYFIVGEYGDQTWRPHYHAILFGLREPEAVESAWQLGYVGVGFVTPQSCAYVAGYTVKRMTVKGDARLGGRAPEFARMSLRPGIGAGAVPYIRGAYVDRESGEVLTHDGDVPSVVRSGGKLWPLGRYLRARVRGGCGGKRVQSERARELQAELLVPGQRAVREERRDQSRLNARSRNSIGRSKKGGRL